MMTQLAMARARGRPDAHGLWRQFFALAEMAFAFFAISVYCYAFLPAARFRREGNDQVQGDTDPTNQICQLLILGVVLLLMILYRRQVLALARRMPGTFAIWILVGGSAAWSDDGLLTLRRALVFAVTTLFGLYLTVRFDFRQVCRLLAWVGLFTALCSLALMTAMPSIGLEQIGQNAGLPRGVFATKNVLGFIMTLCSIFAFSAALVERRAWFYWGCWTICIALALLSRSATVAVTLMAVYAAWAAAAAYRRAPRYRPLLIYAVALPIAILAGAALLFPEGLTALLGKDTSLSGRDVLWAAVWDFIKERPILGYGYGAFWRDAGPQAHLIGAMLGWEPPHAHNAVLEILLETGLVGLVWVTLYYAAIWWRLLRRVASGDLPEAAPLLAMMVAFLVQGFSEANLLHQGDIDWALTVYLVAILARPVASHHRSPAR